MTTCEIGSIEIGSVLSRESARLLANCCFCRRVLFSRSSSPEIQYSWLLCTLDREHCDFHGKCARFKVRFDGYHVIWRCSKLVGLPSDFLRDSV